MQGNFLTSLFYFKGKQANGLLSLCLLIQAVMPPAETKLHQGILYIRKNTFQSPQENASIINVLKARQYILKLWRPIMVSHTYTRICTRIYCVFHIYVAQFTADSTIAM